MPSTSSAAEPAHTLGRIMRAVEGYGVRRSRDSWLGGVCSGLARRWDIDPAIVRVAAVVLVLMTGAGAVLYCLAWVLLPAADGPSYLRRVTDGGPGPIAAAVGLAAAAVVAGVTLLGDISGSGWGLWWPGKVLVIGLLTYGVWTYVIRPRSVPHLAPPSGGDPVAEDPAAGEVERVAPPPPSWAGPGTQEATLAAEPAPVVPVVPVVPLVPLVPDVTTDPVHTEPGVAQPAQPRGSRRRLPFWAGLITAGAALLVGVGVASVHRYADWRGDATSVGLAAALAVVAVVLLAAALTGRRGGLTTLLGVGLGLAVALNSTMPLQMLRHGMGDRTWVVADASTPYRLGMGDAILDLTHLPASSTGPEAITTRLGMGQLTIRVPEGTRLRVRGRIDLGAATLDGKTVSDLPSSRVTFDRTFGTGPAQLLVDAHVGMGELAIVEVKP